jgi:AraC family transcriptional regulator
VTHSVEESIEHVIKAMHERIGEQITIDDMAQIAMFSKFHFSRIFRNTTGISPGRFLSALRLQEAKILLVSTSLTIADISNQVGYSSIGTFSYRFKRSIGVSPSVYRANGGLVTRELMDGQANTTRRGSATIQGKIVASGACQCSTVFIGLFPDVLPQGLPTRCTFRHGPGSYVLEKVPSGSWYVLACSFSEPEKASSRTAAGIKGLLEVPGELAIGVAGPIEIRPGAGMVSTDVWLRPARTLDPPILFMPFDVQLIPRAAAS